MSFSPESKNEFSTDPTFFLRGLHHMDKDNILAKTNYSFEKRRKELAKKKKKEEKRQSKLEKRKGTAEDKANDFPQEE
jgi:hypothetical protein